MESSNDDSLIMLSNLMGWDKRPDKQYLVGLGWTRGKPLGPNTKKHTQEMIKRINKMEFLKLFMSLINVKKESESVAQQHQVQARTIYGIGWRLFLYSG